MGQFDQFANQGGPAAENAESLAAAKRKTDEQLASADYSGDLPEPLAGGRHVAAPDDTGPADPDPIDEGASDR